jgi:26S proteasome regulatory subunit N2
LFKLLLRLFLKNSNPDWSSITIIWAQSNNVAACSDAMSKLITAQDQWLQIYQIAFDLYEIASQKFVADVRQTLNANDLGASDIEVRSAITIFDLADQTGPRIASKRSRQDPEWGCHRQVPAQLHGQKPQDRYHHLPGYQGKPPLHSDETNADCQDVLEDRYSIYHSAITFSQAYASCGTTNDTFMRANLDWLARSNNWSKFSATASLGLVHKGSLINGQRIVKPYLPNGPAPSKFSEGGALYALGMIYAGRKDGAAEELKAGLADGMDPVVQHGAALGYGISAVSSADEGMLLCFPPRNDYS